MVDGWLPGKLRWRATVSAPSEREAVGAFYVAKTFPPDAKAQMDELKACASESRFRKDASGNAVKLYWNSTGGTLTDTNASSPTTRGPGFGTWTQTAPGQYSVKFRFYRYNADGSLAGSTVVTSKRTLSADGNAYTGDTRSEVRDLAGTVVAQTCVADVGTRFS